MSWFNTRQVGSKDKQSVSRPHNLHSCHHKLNNCRSQGNGAFIRLEDIQKKTVQRNDTGNSWDTQARGTSEEFLLQEGMWLRSQATLLACRWKALGLVLATKKNRKRKQSSPLTLLYSVTQAKEHFPRRQFHPALHGRKNHLLNSGIWVTLL